MPSPLSEMLQYLLEEELDSSPSNEPTETMYVVLTDTKTWFSRTTALITRQKYNHISMTFDRSLKQMWTFDMGDNTIQMETPEIWHPDTRFVAYSIKITSEAKDRIVQRIEEINRNKGSYFYSKGVLIKGALNRLVGTDFKLTAEQTQ